MSTENEKNRTDDKNIKGDDVMTPELVTKDFNAKESFIESLEQMKAMRDGKIKKTTWDDFMKELEEEGYLD